MQPKLPGALIAWDKQCRLKTDHDWGMRQSIAQWKKKTYGGHWAVTAGFRPVSGWLCGKTANHLAGGRARIAAAHQEMAHVEEAAVIL